MNVSIIIVIIIRDHCTSQSLLGECDGSLQIVFVVVVVVATRALPFYNADYRWEDDVALDHGLEDSLNAHLDQFASCSREINVPATKQQIRPSDKLLRQLSHTHSGFTHTHEMDNLLQLTLLQLT